MINEHGERYSSTFLHSTIHDDTDTDSTIEYFKLVCAKLATILDTRYKLTRCICLFKHRTADLMDEFLVRQYAFGKLNGHLPCPRAIIRNNRYKHGRSVTEHFPLAITGIQKEILGSMDNRTNVITPCMAIKLVLNMVKWTAIQILLRRQT